MNRLGGFTAADFDQIPYTKKCAGQEHEYKPGDDIRHQQAGQRLLTRDGAVHDGFRIVIQPTGRATPRVDIVVSFTVGAELEDSTRDSAILRVD